MAFTPVLRCWRTLLSIRGRMFIVKPRIIFPLIPIALLLVCRRFGLLTTRFSRKIPLIRRRVRCRAFLARRLVVQLRLPFRVFSRWRRRWRVLSRRRLVRWVLLLLAPFVLSGRRRKQTSLILSHRKTPSTRGRQNFPLVRCGRRTNLVWSTVIRKRLVRVLRVLRPLRIWRRWYPFTSLLLWRRRRVVWRRRRVVRSRVTPLFPRFTLFKPRSFRRRRLRRLRFSFGLRSLFVVLSRRRMRSWTPKIFTLLFWK